MAELTDELVKEIHETHHRVIGIETALKGFDGKSGLVAEVADHNKKIDKINQRLMLLIGILGGSGALGGTAYGLVQLLK